MACWWLVSQSAYETDILAANDFRSYFHKLIMVIHDNIYIYLRKEYM